MTIRLLLLYWTLFIVIILVGISSLAVCHHDEDSEADILITIILVVLPFLFKETKQS